MRRINLANASHFPARAISFIIAVTNSRVAGSMLQATQTWNRGNRHDSRRDGFTQSNRMEERGYVAAPRGLSIPRHFRKKNASSVGASDSAIRMRVPVASRSNSAVAMDSGSHLDYSASGSQTECSSTRIQKTLRQRPAAEPGSTSYRASRAGTWSAGHRLRRFTYMSLP